MDSSALYEINPAQYFKSYTSLPAVEKSKFIERFVNYLKAKAKDRDIDLDVAESALTGCSLRLASLVNKDFEKCLREVQNKCIAVSKAGLCNVFERSAMDEYRFGFRSELPPQMNRIDEVGNSDENEPIKSKQTRKQKALQHTKFISLCILENISKCNIKIIEDEVDWDNFTEDPSKTINSPYEDDVILSTCKLFEPNGEAYGCRNDFGVCGYICEKDFLAKPKPCVTCTHDKLPVQENDSIDERVENTISSLAEFISEYNGTENNNETNLGEKEESIPHTTAMDYIIESAFPDGDNINDDKENSNTDDHWDDDNDRNSFDDGRRHSSSEEDTGDVNEFKCKQTRRLKENIKNVKSDAHEQWELANPIDDEKDCPIKVGRVINMPDALKRERVIDRYEQSTLVLDDLGVSVVVRWKGGMFLDPAFMDINWTKRKEREMNAKKNKISLKDVDLYSTEDADERSNDVDMVSEDEDHQDINDGYADHDDDPEEDAPLNLDINFEGLRLSADSEEDINDPAYLYDKQLKEEKMWKEQALKDIDKKVALCHKQLKILIQEDESRPSLDVHECAKRILNSFPDDRPIFKFTDLPILIKEEKTFYFFTCLQLVNSGNLEILTPNNVAEGDCEFRIINRSLLRDNIENAQI